jgi:hypothetical protein
MRNKYRILARKYECKKPLMKSDLRQENNNETDKKKCEDVDWILLAYDKIHWRTILNTAMNIQVHNIRRRS